MNHLFLLITAGIFNLFSFQSQAQVLEVKSPLTSIYDIHINTLEGDSLDLSAFKGKKLLIVNVASKCGFTPQYKDLQKLHDLYGKDVVIIGVPCNQFGGQEPGDEEEIATFCERNYGVTFQMTEKVDVKGKNQHPLYAWLTDKAKNGSEDSKVRWNFQKYVISENGELLALFGSNVNPMSEEIQVLFK